MSHTINPHSGSVARQHPVASIAGSLAPISARQSEPLRFSLRHRLSTTDGHFRSDHQQLEAVCSADGSSRVELPCTGANLELVFRLRPLAIGPQSVADASIADTSELLAVIARTVESRELEMACRAIVFNLCNASWVPTSLRPYCHKVRIARHWADDFHVDEFPDGGQWPSRALATEAERNAGAADPIDIAREAIQPVSDFLHKGLRSNAGGTMTVAAEFSLPDDHDGFLLDQPAWSPDGAPIVDARNIRRSLMRFDRGHGLPIDRLTAFSADHYGAGRRDGVLLQSIVAKAIAGPNALTADERMYLVGMLIRGGVANTQAG